MEIDRRFFHFKKFSTFNSKKLSANEANTQYTLGVNGAVTTGVPDIPYDAIVWIKDTQQQWTHGQLYDFSEADYYGVEWDTTVATPACSRIGNMEFHRTLPIQSRMRGCLLDDNGHVVEYLDADDWRGAVRDGSKGQVMVEIPAHWRKFETEGTMRRVKISESPLSGYHLVPKQYVSAYEATVQRSTTKLCSVVNSNTDYRGGNNTASYDGTYRSLLGRPATSLSRTNFRDYARKRKPETSEWNCLTYDIQKELYWLFVIEYATFNSQAAYNAAKDANGYMQGGLGDGVTTWDGTSWSNYNGYNPFVPCGHTDSLGNASGIVAYTVKNSSNADLKTFNVPRYRGIENPFGHIWKWADGVNVRISPTTANGGDNLSKVFVCSDPAFFTDSSYNGYAHVGNEARAEGFAKSHIFGEITPDAVGGSSTTYMCDYHYTNIPTTEALRVLRFGGDGYDNESAGFGASSSRNTPSETNKNIGSRLCFIPSDTYDYDDLINKPYMKGGVRLATGNALPETNATTITTAQFIAKLTELGLFKQSFGVVRGSFEYAHNDRITDTGIDVISLYGAVVEVFGLPTQYTIRVTTTSMVHSAPYGVARHQYMYFYNGDNYQPGWAKVVNLTDLENYLPKTGGVINGDVEIKGNIMARNFVSDTTTPIVNVAATSQALAPNRMYVWNKAQSRLTLTLDPPANAGILNKYMAQFPIYNNTVVTLPADISWAGGKAPTFTNGNVYQLSIIDKKAVYSEFIGVYTEPEWSLADHTANLGGTGFSKLGVDSSGNTVYACKGKSIATITIKGYSTFTLYVRHSNGTNANMENEGEHDYMVVGDLDKSIMGYSQYDTAGVKITTQGNDTPDEGGVDPYNINAYTQVQFNNIGGGTHTIMVYYYKDTQYNVGEDAGYILIPEQ